jgi:Glutathione S-transferase
MKLYFHPVSTTSRPIMLFAADNQIELEYQVVDLLTGEHKQSAFTAINPNQAVPVLEDGDFRLTESSAILKYLAEKTASRDYPSHPAQRARINERMDWFNTGLSRELCYGIVYPQIFPHQRRPDDHVQAQSLAWSAPLAERYLNILDSDLIGSNPYLCGNHITIADYFGIGMLTLGEVVRIDFSRWRNISQWIARMKDRPSWAKVNEAFYTYLVQPLAGGTFQTI